MLVLVGEATACGNTAFDELDAVLGSEEPVFPPAHADTNASSMVAAK
jgi:hypothetical protein